jgi:transcription termination/antitermination protein NusG
MHWYVLRVAANKEMQVKDALERKTEQEGLMDVVGRIEVPTEQIKRIRAGKQTVHKRKLYPGYVFMEMEPTEDGRVPEGAWFMIKGTGGVAEEAPSIKVEFEKGDHIKIREGAFENFEGSVDSIDAERGIVKVIVTIFGRSTPLDIEYWQIEKV